jgi:hypothetical protein
MRIIRSLEDAFCTLLALILIIGIEITLLIVIYVPWIKYSLTGYKIALLVIIHLLYISVWANYLACVFTDPGGDLPDNYVKQFILGEDGEIECPADMAIKDRPRWCTRCAQVKPPRAHHCSQCNVCILKMDHHCPWMGTCIGLKNHGHFVRFCGYVLLCCLASLLAVIQWMVERYARPDYQMQELAMDWRLVLLVFSVSCAIGTAAFVGVLAGYHIHAVVNNKTTLEAMEEIRLRKQLQGDDLRRYRFPYTLESKYESTAVTFGTIWPVWPFPTAINLPDGLYYKVHPKSLFGGQWPIRFKENDDVETQEDNEWAHESSDYRRRIRKDSEGFLLPQRLFPELYVKDGASEERGHSQPHLIKDSTLSDGTKRRVTRSLSPKQTQ